MIILFGLLVYAYNIIRMSLNIITYVNIYINTMLTEFENNEQTFDKQTVDKIRSFNQKISTSLLDPTINTGDTGSISTNNNIQSNEIDESKKKKKVKSTPIPIPFMGTGNAELCDALRFNKGLYTQCPNLKIENEKYCCSCNNSDNIIKYGTIHDRCKSDIMNYIDPDGRSPIPYANVLRKLKIPMANAREYLQNTYPDITPLIHFEPVIVKSSGRPRKSQNTISTSVHSIHMSAEDFYNDDEENDDA